MNASDAFQSFFKNITNTNGRASRSEFWWPASAIGIIDLAIWSVIRLRMLALASDGNLFGLMWLQNAMWVLITITLLLTISLCIRRLHDRDLSAGWIAFYFIPIVNIGIFVLQVLPGTKGPNRFGPDPLELEKGNASAVRPSSNQSSNTIIQQPMAAAGPPAISVSEKLEPVASTSNADGAMQKLEPPPNLQIDEDELFQQAFEELENNEKVVATWSRSFAEASGDEQKAKALYIQHRVAALKATIIETYNQELAEAEAKEEVIAQELSEAKAKAEAEAKVEAKKRNEEREKEKKRRIENPTAEEKAAAQLQANRLKKENRRIFIISACFIAIILGFAIGVSPEQNEADLVAEKEAALAADKDRCAEAMRWDKDIKEYVWDGYSEARRGGYSLKVCRSILKNYH